MPGMFPSPHVQRHGANMAGDETTGLRTAYGYFARCSGRHPRGGSMTSRSTDGRLVSAVAPFRRDPEGVLHAEMVPSACPDPALATGSRRDPFWDRLWAPWPQAVWTTAPMARTRAGQ